VAELAVLVLHRQVVVTDATSRASLWEGMGWILLNGLHKGCMLSYTAVWPQLTLLPPA
jgi:hypothetical protein